MHPLAKNLRWVRPATNLTIGSSAAFIDGFGTSPLGGGKPYISNKISTKSSISNDPFLDAELNFVVVTRKLHLAFRHSVQPPQFHIIKSAGAELKSCL